MEKRELTGAHNKAEKLQTWTSPRGTHPWPPKQTLSLKASESSYAWSYKPHQLSSWVSFWLMTFFFGGGGCPGSLFWCAGFSYLQYAGFFCLGALALELVGSAVAASGLAALRHVRS